MWFLFSLVHCEVTLQQPVCVCADVADKVLSGIRLIPCTVVAVLHLQSFFSAWQTKEKQTTDGPKSWIKKTFQIIIWGKVGHVVKICSGPKNPQHWPYCQFASDSYFIYTCVLKSGLKVSEHETLSVHFQSSCHIFLVFFKAVMSCRVFTMMHHPRTAEHHCPNVDLLVHLSLSLVCR